MRVFVRNLVSKTFEPILYLVRVATDGRFAGNRVSRVLRRVFENRFSKRVFGVNLMALTVFVGVVVPPTSAIRLSEGKPELISISSSVTKLTTNHTVARPFASFSVSQGFSTYHPGIDLQNQSGTEIRPIMEGTVEQVNHDFVGYGYHVVIDHGEGFESLYGHMSKIMVKPGQKVDLSTVVGLVGSTGHSTGPHLHLEVLDHGTPFNPLVLLNRS